MTTNALTTEADLEARINTLLRKIFSHLPPDAIKHQTRFELTLGRQRIDIGEAKPGRRTGRADVFLELYGKPLAILELKRPDHKLLDKDVEQGQSYALLKRAPLTIISNGSSTRFINTFSGEDWSPSSGSESEFKNLISSAGRVAEEAVTSAIKTLMATDPNTWQPIVRHHTEQIIRDLTGSPTSPGTPFLEGFLVPRETTCNIMTELRNGATTIVLEGDPLSGKSSVLRELVVATQDDPNYAILYIDASHNVSIYECVSNFLCDSLDWPANTEEARHWLRRLSKNSKHSLVLAVDEYAGSIADLDQQIHAIDDMTRQGKGLRLILSVGKECAHKLLSSSSGRSASRLASRARLHEVLPLSSDEFEAAEKELAGLGLHFMRGAKASPEYRQPWILRSSVQMILASDDGTHGLMPPTLGRKLIHSAPDLSEYDPELARIYLALARAVVEDALDEHRDDLLQVQSLHNYIVRDRTLSDFLSREDVKELQHKGYLKLETLTTLESIYVVRMPESLLKYLVKAIRHRMKDDSSDSSSKVADHAEIIASRLPLGHVLVADALLMTWRDEGGSTSGVEVIAELIERPPVQIGTRCEPFHGVFQAGGLNGYISKNAEGSWEVEAYGKRIEFQPTDKDELKLYDRPYPWLILSHIANVPAILEDSSEVNEPVPVQGILLLQLAEARSPLIAPTPFGDGFQYQSIEVIDLPNDITVISPDSGAIEPLTLSIYEFLLREVEVRDEWISAAIDQMSPAVVHRVYVALRELYRYSHDSVWASATLKARVIPSLEKML